VERFRWKSADFVEIICIVFIEKLGVQREQRVKIGLKRMSLKDGKSKYGAFTSGCVECQTADGKRRDRNYYMHDAAAIDRCNHYYFNCALRTRSMCLRRGHMLKSVGAGN
jgi:hypothetical protein